MADGVSACGHYLSRTKTLQRLIGLSGVAAIFHGGVYIIIAFAFIYGAQVIGWEASVRNIMFIIVQITAAAGALGFGWIQDRLGAKHTYQITLALWVCAIVAIWLTPQFTDWVNQATDWQWQAQYVFCSLGAWQG